MLYKNRKYFKCNLTIIVKCFKLIIIEVDEKNNDQ